MQRRVAPLRVARERDALQRRIGDVVRPAIEIRVALEHDQVADAIAVGHDARLPVGGSLTPARVQAGFDIARRLRAQIGIREAGEVEIVERRRLERGSGACGDAPAREEPIAPGERAGRLAAELARIVMPQVRLHGMVAAPRSGRCRSTALVSRELTANPASDVDALLAPLERKRQRAGRQRDVVLPRVLPLVRLEREIAERASSTPTCRCRRPPILATSMPA